MVVAVVVVVHGSPGFLIRFFVLFGYRFFILRYGILFQWFMFVVCLINYRIWFKGKRKENEKHSLS